MGRRTARRCREGRSAIHACLQHCGWLMSRQAYHLSSASNSLTTRSMMRSSWSWTKEVLRKPKASLRLAAVSASFLPSFLGCPPFLRPTLHPNSTLVMTSTLIPHTLRRQDLISIPQAIALGTVFFDRPDGTIRRYRLQPTYITKTKTSDNTSPTKSKTTSGSWGRAASPDEGLSLLATFSRAL